MLLRREMGVEEAGRRALMFVVVPIWLGAGIVDYVFHRRTRIEHTAGPKEAAVHVAMMTEALIPSLMGLFLEVNAAVLATGMAALAAHQGTAMFDVRFAESRRRVLPGEQNTHSFLEVVPIMGLTLLSVMHWDQLQALFGRGPERADFSFRPKSRPLPRAFLVANLAAIGVGAALYVEELVRCVRAAPTRKPLSREARTHRTSSST